MIPVLPAPLHRAALKLAQRIRLAWWGWRKPELHGCNVVARNRAGAVLLVRHSYQAPDRWMLPGGGLAAGESAEAGACREMREETGCRIEQATCFGVEIEDLGGARNHVHLVAAVTDDSPVADRREIVEAAFFAPDALPATTASAARRRIERWRAQPPQPSGSSA